MSRAIEMLYPGTRVNLAMGTAQCPIDCEQVKPAPERKFGGPVVPRTHTD